MAIGSPFFMSPEVFYEYLSEIGENGKGLEDNSNQNFNYIKSDVYSTAVSLVQMYNPSLPLNSKETVVAKRN